MANEKEFKIRLVAEGGAAAAQEIAAVEQATEGVADAAGRAGRNAGAVATVADGAQEAAQEINQVGEALQGTGLEALGLGDKLSGARARLEELKRASAEAAGPEALEKVNLEGKKLEELFPTFTKLGGSVDEWGTKLVELAGGPIGLVTIGFSTLMGVIAQTRSEMEAMLDDADKAATGGVNTAQRILKDTRTEDEVRESFDPAKIEEYRSNAKGAAQRLLDLDAALKVLKDPDVSAGTLRNVFGGDEVIGNIIERVAPAETMSLRSDTPNAPASELLRRSDLVRSKFSTDVTLQIENERRTADLNMEKFRLAERAGGKLGGEAQGIATEAETLARTVAARGQGGNDLVQSLNAITEILRDGLQNGEMKKVTELVGDLTAQVRTARAEDRAALDRLRSEVGQLASRVSANRSFTDD